MYPSRDCLQGNVLRLHQDQTGGVLEQGGRQAVINGARLFEV
jgi:hypothetical protein